MVAPVQAVVTSGVQTPAPSITATFGSTTLNGDTMFVFTWSDSGKAVTSITDDATPPNTYTQVAVVSGATSYGPSDASLWVSTTHRPCKNIIATWPAATSNAGVMIAEYPGTWNFVAQNHGTNSADPPNPSSGNFSNTKAGDLILGTCAGFFHAGAGYTERLYANPGLWEDLTASTASSTNNATGQSGFAGWIMIGASFTSPSAAAPANSVFFNTD